MKRCLSAAGAAAIKISAISICSVLSAFSAAEAKASRGSMADVPDVLLVLGCTVHGSTPCEDLRCRIEKAADFLLQHENVLCIPCGGIVQSDQTVSEAEVIASELEKHGVLKSRIVLENQSTTTEENFIFASKIISSLNLTQPKIAFLSSEYHLLRAGYIAKKAGVTAKTIPARTPWKIRGKAYARELLVFPDAVFKRRKHD